VSPLTLLLFFKIVLPIWGPFLYHVNFRISLFCFWKAVTLQILVSIEKEITLGSTASLTILNLPIHEVFSFSFMYSLIYFINILHKIHDSLVKFIPKYFVLIDVITSGIVLLISFSDFSLLVYRNATYFYIFILYSAIWMN
jgi:hypothetical protein